MTIQDYIKEIKEREAKATKGPWEFKATKDTGGIRYVFAPNEKKDYRGCEFLVADVNMSYNAELIAHARQDIPKLVRMVEIMAEALQVVQDHSDDKAMALGANIALQKASKVASENS